MITIFTDGACKGNPGIKGIGGVIELDTKTLYMCGNKGYGTNNEAEYQALLEILIKLYNMELLNIKNIIKINSDSELMINQLSGKYKIKSSNLKELYSEIKDYLSDQDVSYKHIPREYNSLSDDLANKGTKLLLDAIIWEEKKS